MVQAGESDSETQKEVKKNERSFFGNSYVQLTLGIGLLAVVGEVFRPVFSDMVNHTPQSTTQSISGPYLSNVFGSSELETFYIRKTPDGIDTMFTMIDGQKISKYFQNNIASKTR